MMQQQLREQEQSQAPPPPVPPSAPPPPEPAPAAQQQAAPPPQQDSPPPQQVDPSQDNVGMEMAGINDAMDQTNSSAQAGDAEGKAEEEAAADMINAPSNDNGGGVLQDADSDEFIQDMGQSGKELESEETPTPAEAKFDDAMDRAEDAAERGDTVAQSEAEGDIGQSLGEAQLEGEEKKNDGGLSLDPALLWKKFTGDDEKNVAVAQAVGEYKDDAQRYEKQKRSNAEEYKGIQQPKRSQRSGRGGQEMRPTRR